MTPALPLMLSVIVAVAVSPLSAAWTAALAGGQRTGWWRPRPVSARRWAVVATVSVMTVLLGTAGAPPLAWWLLAVGGTVLAIVDAQTQLLPARLTYPLAAVITAVLVAAAVTGAGTGPLLRAVLAAGTVGGLWMAVCFLSPRSIGLGDVRLAALTSGVLGWAGWGEVWQGQVLTLLLGALTGVIAALTARQGPHSSVTVPMGPAMIAGSLLALWL